MWFWFTILRYKANTKFTKGCPQGNEKKIKWCVHKIEIYCLWHDALQILIEQKWFSNIKYRKKNKILCQYIFIFVTHNLNPHRRECIYAQIKDEGNKLKIKEQHEKLLEGFPVKVFSIFQIHVTKIRRNESHTGISL